MDYIFSKYADTNDDVLLYAKVASPFEAVDRDCRNTNILSRCFATNRDSRAKIQVRRAGGYHVDSLSVIIAWHKEDRWRTSSESACNKRTQRQMQTKPY